MVKRILPVKSRVAILLVLGLMILATFSVFGISCGSSTPAPTDKVEMSGLAFKPGTITVSVGTTVTWTNKEAAAHTVTSNDNLFASGNLSRDDTFQFTFTQSGTFQYHCAIHPSMTGTVIVK